MYQPMFTGHGAFTFYTLWGMKHSGISILTISQMLKNIFITIFSPQVTWIQLPSKFC